MLDITKLWDKNYLFGSFPGLVRSDYIFSATAAIFIVLGIIAKLWAMRLENESPKKKLLSRYFRLNFTVGILISLWFGARYEAIPWLATHFVVLVLLIIWAVWLFFVVRENLTRYRRQQSLWEEDVLKRKYLPR